MTSDPAPDAVGVPNPDPSVQADRRERGGRVRSVAAGIVGVLALVSLLATTMAVWASATLFDSEKVGTIFSDALAEPEVEAALADYVTEQVFTAVDVGALVDEVLPDELDRLQPSIVAGARTAVERGLARALASPQVQETLTRVVERGHAAAMRLLEGDGLLDGVVVADGEVTVNMLPLLGRGVGQLQERGLFGELELPELTAEGDPDEQIAALETALDRDLPDDFGQLVVYRSDTLDESQASLQSAQQVFAFAKRVGVWVLLPLTVVLIAVTLLLARNRWRATLLLGLGGIVVMVITRSAVHRVVDEAPDLAARPGGRAAISAMVGGASTGLLRLAGVLLIIAAAAVCIALFRRHWPRSDLALVGAVLTGVVVVAVLGLSITSLLLGVALAAAVPVVVGRLGTVGYRPSGHDEVTAAGR